RSDKAALAPCQRTAHGLVLRGQLVQERASDRDVVQPAERVLQCHELREKWRERAWRKAASEEVAAIAQPLQRDAHCMPALDIAPVDAPRALREFGVCALERAPREADQRLGGRITRAPRIGLQP